MKKLKKIFASFNLLVIGWFSKAFADFNTIAITPLYGPGNDIEPRKIDIIERILSKISYYSIFVFFIIGLFVAFNKKLSKKEKIITIVLFIAIVVLLRLIVFCIEIND